LPGLYVSRRDERDGVCVTTFDMRVTAPNREPVIDMPALHTIEHLGATFFRNSEIARDVVYFGPMGCRTGFYLLVRNADNNTVLSVVKEVLRTIAEDADVMFGAERKECGNYRELSLDAAKCEAARYLRELSSREQTFEYPKE
jgi:S-ribosylhomocysteine lyase